MGKKGFNKIYREPHNFSSRDFFESRIKDLLQEERKWYDPITKKLKDPKLNDIGEIIKNLNAHKDCPKCRDGRVPALYCRLVLEYICQTLMIIGFKNRKIKFNQTKNRFSKRYSLNTCRSYPDLFKFLSLNDMIEVLKGELIDRRDNSTCTMYGLMVSIQKSTNEALHVIINKKNKIIKKKYNIKTIISESERLIEEFNEKF